MGGLGRLKVGLVVLVRGAAMVEAAKTTATAGEIWVICVVMVICLAFWLSMVAWADKNPVHRGRRELPDMNVPVLGGMHVAGASGRSVAPHRDAPAVLTDADETAEARAGAEPGRARVPGQRVSETDQPELLRGGQVDEGG